MKYCYQFAAFSLLILLSACNNKSEDPSRLGSNTAIKALYTNGIKLDGHAYDDIWKKSEWHPIDQRWLGKEFLPEDFTGRYKVAWSTEQLFLLAEITDDVFLEKIPHGLERYWDDDCLEIFLDEDHSGGNHQYSHQAFAYHVSLKHDVTDMGTDSLPHYYKEHITDIHTLNGNTMTWELSIFIYDKSFQDPPALNVPVRLAAGKKMGFAMAYCDNDYSDERENFIGSVAVAGDDKNRGWIDAGIFGSLELTY
ncbi:MAG: sugar-binding protein [Bacteroidota bacterium]